MSQFDEHRVQLQNPDKETIQSAFQNLPKRGMLQIHGTWEERVNILNQLELLGCFGIFLIPSNNFQNVSITALKGKSGPCYETGRTATYHGAATAVLDDDSHFINGKIRVCEKTGLIYSLPTYQKLISVSQADTDLLVRLDSEPILFDCDTYESDLHEILKKFDKIKFEYNLNTSVLYKGPFRLLVLSDGTILRRGVVTLVSRDQAKKMSLKDNVLELPDSFITEAESPQLLTEIYKSNGSACLLYQLDESNDYNQISEKDSVKAIHIEPDFSSLDTISSRLKKRILHLIEKSRPYFILTGSDPEDQHGCCPNDLVGEANQLVEKGILSRYNPPAPPDACTSIIYAFPEEIDNCSPPKFNINQSFREEFYKLLTESQAKSSKIIKNIS